MDTVKLKSSKFSRLKSRSVLLARGCSIGTTLDVLSVVLSCSIVRIPTPGPNKIHLYVRAKHAKAWHYFGFLTDNAVDRRFGVFSQSCVCCFIAENAPLRIIYSFLGHVFWGFGAQPKNGHRTSNVLAQMPMDRIIRKLKTKV